MNLFLYCSCHIIRFRLDSLMFQTYDFFNLYLTWPSLSNLVLSPCLQKWEYPRKFADSYSPLLKTKTTECRSLAKGRLIFDFRCLRTVIIYLFRNLSWSPPSLPDRCLVKGFILNTSLPHAFPTLDSPWITALIAESISGVMKKMEVIISLLQFKQACFSEVSLQARQTSTTKERRHWNQLHNTVRQRHIFAATKLSVGFKAQSVVWPNCRSSVGRRASSSKKSLHMQEYPKTTTTL